MITLDRIVERINELAPLPPTAMRLAGLLASPGWSIEECVETIRYDQALTAEILRYVNSAYSGALREITSIKDAVVRLGGGRILEEILARHLRQNLAAPLPAYGYSERDLWRHSVAAAAAAEALGAYAPTPMAGLAFTAALLHDIGKLVLARLAPSEAMEAVWKMASDGRATCEKAEKTLLGFSHAEVGAAMIDAWKLPAAIAAAVKNHHAESDPADPMTDCVMAANLVARSIGEGIGNEGMCVGGDAQVAKRLGLTKDKFELVCAKTKIRVEDVLAAFGAER
jgi:putative nucleotidyltransferase with HDIG domain